MVCFTGIISQEQFFKKCTLIPSNLQFECMQLLAKYEIVLNLGESHYLIPSLLPSDIQHSPVPRISVAIRFNSVDSSVVASEYEDEDSSDDGDDKDYVNGDVYDDDVDDDDDNYVNLMVDRAKLLAEDQYCIIAKRSKSPNSSLSSSNSSTSPDVHTNAKLPIVSTTSPSQSTKPNFFNFDLLASHNFENVTDLLSTYKYKENICSTMNNGVDITCYPALCRIWLSPFIPKSFWFRLVSRIVSATDITNVILKLLPTIDLSSIKDTQFSLWSLWQHGTAVIHKDITFLELKCRGNVTRNREKNKSQKIFLSINVPEFLVYHHKSNAIQPDLSLSYEDVLGQATKLLVAIDQLILEICEWFPRTLIEDDLGGVLSYTPCCFCLQNDNSFKQFTGPTDKCTMISYDGLEVYCFSFTEMLASYADDTAIVCPRHGKIPVQLCAPDMVS